LNPAYLNPGSEFWAFLPLSERLEKGIKLLALRLCFTTGVSLNGIKVHVLTKYWIGLH